MRVKLLERVVVVVVTHTAHTLYLGSIGKRETIVVMAINHVFIEINGCIVIGDIVIKFPVGVIDQDNQAAELAVVHVATMTHTTQQSIAVVKQLCATLNHLIASQPLGNTGECGTVSHTKAIYSN